MMRFIGLKLTLRKASCRIRGRGPVLGHHRENFAAPRSEFRFPVFPDILRKVNHSPTHLAAECGEPVFVRMGAPFKPGAILHRYSLMRSHPRTFFRTVHFEGSKSYLSDPDS